MTVTSADYARSHSVVTRAVATLPDGQQVQMRATGGQVQCDARADVRRRFDGLTLVAETLSPAVREALTEPNAVEVQLSRGLLTPDGRGDLRSLGVFAVLDLDTAEDSGGGVALTVKGDDRSYWISGNRWDRPYSVAPGQDLGTAIAAALRDRYPLARLNFAPTPGLTTAGLLFGTSSQNNPWTDLTDLARSGGHELFPDAEGVFVLRPIPDPRTAPVAWTLAGRTLGVNRALTSRRSYSRVIVAAESTGLDAPVRAVAVSPDEVPGRVRPYFYTSPAIRSQQQADDVAAALLRDVDGLYEDVQFESLVDPTVDVGSIGWIKRGALGVNGRYVLEQLSIPMGHDESSSGACRGQRVAA